MSTQKRNEQSSVDTKITTQGTEPRKPSNDEGMTTNDILVEPKKSGCNSMDVVGLDTPAASLRSPN